ncbi:hypothetical protein VNI00_000715 [Paramarasmius palmivorus]|uniref:Uncharacterized protein n=1 Tax=Paramarasmius palmivorus TaxID=297713 RepID=A0AAW0E9T6_9AGAR
MALLRNAPYPSMKFPITKSKQHKHPDQHLFRPAVYHFELNVQPSYSLALVGENGGVSAPVVDQSGDEASAETHTLDNRATVSVPEACLLWLDPECLGLPNLSANDRYQIVCLSLKAKGLDASQLLYKKAKKDTKEAQQAMKSAGAEREVEKLEGSGEDGLMRCPTCRRYVYAISRTWVLLTPAEEAARASNITEKRAKNKDNRILARLERKENDLDPPQSPQPVSSETLKTTRLRLVLDNDRISQIKRNIDGMPLAVRFPSRAHHTEYIQSYRRAYPSSDARDEEILELLPK